MEKGHGLERPIGIGRIHHHPAPRFITCQHLDSAGKAMDSLRQESSLHFSLKKRQTEALQLEGTGCRVMSAGTEPADWPEAAT